MICSVCGALNAASAASCSRCGRPIGRTGDVPTMQQDTAMWIPDDGGRASAELTPGREIGRRYRIVGLLGKGGMGSVYLAQDSELDREVALKLIRPHLAESPAVLERFKREVRLSSTITHRNVLRVHDLGESDGVHFLTMEYVRGGSLAALLHREGRLAPERALKLFREICEGLAAAHEQQVLHRDLKPENILVDEQDHVHITDFGLAKSLEAARMTQTGAIVGTPHYMAPEQVRGEPADERTDIYALGVILYRMLTGSLPFAGASDWEVALQRLQKSPVPATALNPGIPGYLQQIVERCMERDQALRYESVGKILEDLDTRAPRISIRREIRRRRGIVPALAALLVVVVSWVAWRAIPWGRFGVGGAGRGDPLAAPAPAVGVAPFDNRTGRKDLDWFGEGLARLVMDDLAQSSHVHVVSADRMKSLAAGAPDPGRLIQAAASDGISYVVSGEIVGTDRGLTVAARLTETKSGKEVAARRADGLDDKTLIGAADGISVAARKGLGLPPAQEVDVYGADFLTRSPEAYEDYMKGLNAWTEYRYGPAEEAFRASLKIAPDYTMARYRLAQILAEIGKSDEALAEIRRAVAESTRLPDREARFVRAAEAYFSRRYDEAIAQYEDMVK